MRLDHLLSKESAVHCLVLRVKPHKDLENCIEGQATKSIRWMPRCFRPMKDGASAETLRGAASRQRSEDVRMGQPTMGNAMVSAAEHIGCRR